MIEMDDIVGSSVNTHAQTQPPCATTNVDSAASTSSQPAEETPPPAAASLCGNIALRFASLSKHAFGVLLILCVAVIWVGASEWIQWIFKSEKYDKPYFMTYFNTTGFCFWNCGYLISSTWKKVPLNEECPEGDRNLTDGEGQMESSSAVNERTRLQPPGMPKTEASLSTAPPL